MKRMSRWLAAALAIVMCLSLAACGKDFDAAGYVKSVLDANYQEEYAEYAKFRNLSEEEAEKEIEDNRIALADSDLAGIGEVSDEMRATYVDSIKTIEKLAKYEVKEAEKQEDDSYIVKVEVTPSDVYQTLEQHSADITQEMIDAGSNPLQDASTFLDLLVEAVQRSVDGNTYGEATTLEIKVTADKNGAYGVEDAQMQELEEALFPQS